YTLLPGGSFDSGSAWSTTGGAGIVSGNEPFFVNSKKDSKSLSIPGGGSVTTSAACVTPATPTIPLFAVGGDAPPQLKVETIVPTSKGSTTLQVATIPASGSWAPVLPIYFLTNIVALLNPDGTTRVQFRFTATGKAAWKIDDVYLDPWKVR